MGSIDRMLAWMEERVGKVSYSMETRLGPWSYDCSSAVFHALKAGGFIPAQTWVGNTETLFAYEGSLFRRIDRHQVRRGDLFISGRPGQSSGGAGHTGIAVSDREIIHCTYSRNGICVTPIDGWTAAAGMPTYWYRLVALDPCSHSEDALLRVGAQVQIQPSFERWATGEVANYDVVGEVDRILQVRLDWERPAYLLEHLYSWIWAKDLVEV